MYINEMNLSTNNMTIVPYWNQKECTAIYIEIVFWDFSSHLSPTDKAKYFVYTFLMNKNKCLKNKHALYQNIVYLHIYKDIITTYFQINLRNKLQSLICINIYRTDIHMYLT